MQSHRNCLFLHVLFLSIVTLTLTGTASAERGAPSPQTGGSVALFGIIYSVDGIDITTEAFGGSGALADDANWCGMGVGFKQGATEAQDRIYLTDECGAGGEDIALLTGVEPEPSYAAGAGFTSSSYVVQQGDGGGEDPAGIDWISDGDTGAGIDDNVRVVRSSWPNLDLVGIDADTFPLADLTTNLVDEDDTSGYRSEFASTTTGSCTNWAEGMGDRPTRMYVAGYFDDGPHFAYQAFDLTASAFVNTNSYWLDSIGVPDDTAHVGRDLRGMAFDGVNSYVMVKKPRVAECWIYQFRGAFPDPPASGSAPLPSSHSFACRLDTSTGIAWPEGEPGVASGPHRAGIACGRMVQIGGQSYPVFYVLCEKFLYTLVPQEPSSVENADQYK
jgi:hypothetical protein